MVHEFIENRTRIPLKSLPVRHTPERAIGKRGDGAMKIEHWHSRHALSLGSQLPDGIGDALAVLECVRELAVAFLHSDASEPVAQAKVLTLIRDCQEL
jgi:hypothetical protein